MVKDILGVTIPSKWRVKKIKNGYYLYHGDRYVGPVEDIVGVYEGWRRGRDSNPRGREAHWLSRPAEKPMVCGVTPEPLINHYTSQQGWGVVIKTLRIVKNGENLVVEIFNKKAVELLKELLGLTSSGVTRSTTIHVIDGFREYLLKDRGIMKETARSYLNYLKRLDGKKLDFNLYLEISNNKWMVKCVRLYIDYLEKIGMITEEEGERLRKIFRVKNKNNEIKPYNLDEKKLVNQIQRMRSGVYKTILLLLYYSGVRLSEVVKMLKEFDERRLMCTEVFCRYFLGWRRGRKRCDYIYFPKFLLEEIEKVKGRIGTYDTIRDNLYEEYGIRPKEYRKMFYRVCRDIGIPKEVCDFYQSRITGLSIGDIHYDDLLGRSDDHYTKMLSRLREKFA